MTKLGFLAVMVLNFHQLVVVLSTFLTRLLLTANLLPLDNDVSLLNTATIFRGYRLNNAFDENMYFDLTKLLASANLAAVNNAL